MSSFSLLLFTLWEYMFHSPAVQLLIISTLLLFYGLIYEVWRRSMRVNFLNETSLQNVEKTHPHLPSTRTIVTLLVCIVALWMVGFQHLAGISPIREPVTWIFIAAVCIMTATCVILGELHWRQAREVFFSCIIGTSTALLLATGLSVDALASSNTHWWIMMTLVCSNMLALRSLGTQWSVRGVIIAIVSFGIWMIVL